MTLQKHTLCIPFPGPSHHYWIDPSFYSVHWCLTLYSIITDAHFCISLSHRSTCISPIPAIASASLVDLHSLCIHHSHSCTCYIPTIVDHQHSHQITIQLCTSKHSQGTSKHSAQSLHSHCTVKAHQSTVKCTVHINAQSGLIKAQSMHSQCTADLLSFFPSIIHVIIYY